MGTNIAKLKRGKGAPPPANDAPDVIADDLRQAIQELGEAAWSVRKASSRPLHHSFVSSMRKHPFRFVFGDATKPHVSCSQALIGAIALARALRSHWDGQHTVDGQ